MPDVKTPTVVGPTKTFGSTTTTTTPGGVANLKKEVEDVMKAVDGLSNTPSPEIITIKDAQEKIQELISFLTAYSRAANRTHEEADKAILAIGKLSGAILKLN